MAEKKFKIGTIEAGAEPFFIIGPCVVESEEVAFGVAEESQQLSRRFNIPIIYKSSYLKANRQSNDSFDTIGIDKALSILASVKKKYGLPILTDIHTEEEATMAAEVVDCLQIPAFLCRQTQLIRTAAATGLAVNIKKGQFMAPEDMKEAAEKAEVAGNSKIMLTERGTTFGYHDLVVDFRSLIIMKRIGYPVIFDCTHSVQKPGAAGGSSGGSPEFITPLARAAAAVGVDGLFIETHPDPPNARCDQNCQLKLGSLTKLIEEVLSIWRA
jgi:2-dehydro-3-deoxyphosphooctonate aldolase (KDO 8-P synthase)